MFDYYEHVFTTDDEKDYRGYIDAYITQQHQAGKSHRSPRRTRRPLQRSTGSGGPIRCLITCLCGPSCGSTLLTTTFRRCQSNKCPETF
jgi:hypothetical protein